MKSTMLARMVSAKITVIAHMGTSLLKLQNIQVPDSALRSLYYEVKDG